MPKAAELLSRNRIAAVALLASAIAHAAVFVGLPPRIAIVDEPAQAAYSASLDAMGATLATAGAGAQAAPAPAATVRPRRPKSPHPQSRLAPPPPPMAAFGAAAPAEPAVAPAEPARTAVAEAKVAPAPPERPEVLALAQPAVPAGTQGASRGVKALEPEKFPVESLPASVTIDYQLTSAFADGRATYHWDRQGDTYRIRAEAEAEGFFTLFLEGQIVQESHGTVTAAGLRPERFSERKPGGPPEGLEFDWPGRRITFDRNGERKTTPLDDNTVDWLSMIFQLAHLPPPTESFGLQVFTQRRMYRFQLNVLGVEEIEIPLGRVRALHLRHAAPDNANEVVDVWLGIEQHYLPVKLRFPAARNRLVVEQVATRVTTR